MFKQYYYALFFLSLYTCFTAGQSPVVVHYDAHDQSFQNTDTLQTTIKDITGLKKIADSLVAASWEKGFLLSKATVRFLEPPELSQIHMNLGKKFSHINIEQTYFEEINSDVGISLSRKREKIIPIALVKDHIVGIQDSLSNQGVAFSQISFSNISITSDTLNANLQVAISKVRYIDKIEIKGLTKFPPNLRRYIEQKKLVYNKENIKYVENEIENSQIASIDRPSEILFKQDSTKMFLYLKKARSNNVEGMVGFNNGNDSNLELNGYLNLALSNILNSAETININYRNDGNEITSLKAKVSLPLLFFNRIGSRASLNIIRRDSTYQNQEVSAGLYYQPKRAFTLGMEYKSIQSNDLTVNTDLGDINRKGMNGFVNYFSTSKDLVSRQPNFQGELNIGLYDRAIEEKNENQIIADATISKIWHLNNRNQVYTRMNSFYLTSQSIALSETTQLGGLGSIRGFAENVIDSSKFISIMTEYRRSISKGLYAYSILDVAAFEDFTTAELRNLYGIGAGIAILTKSGLLTLSLANGTFEGANFDLNSTIAHINMNISF